MSINRLLGDIQCFVALDLYALTMYDFYYFIGIEYRVIKNAKKKQKAIVLCDRNRKFYIARASFTEFFARFVPFQK